MRRRIKEFLNIVISKDYLKENVYEI